VDKVVEKVVQKHHNFTCTIFKELGFKGDELEMKGEI